MLQAHSVEINNIKVCSQPLLSRDFYDKKTPNQPSTTIEQLWHKICRKERFNLNDRYLDGQEAFFAFMQTLSNGCVQAAGHECKSYHEVLEHLWLRKAARYIVETLGASNNVSEGAQSAVGTEREGDHDKWSR